MMNEMDLDRELVLTQKQRDGMQGIVDSGFVDRHLQGGPHQSGPQEQQTSGTNEVRLQQERKQQQQQQELPGRLKDTDEDVGNGKGKGDKQQQQPNGGKGGEVTNPEVPDNSSNSDNASDNNNNNGGNGINQSPASQVTVTTDPPTTTIPQTGNVGPNTLAPSSNDTGTSTYTTDMRLPLRLSLFSFSKDRVVGPPSDESDDYYDDENATAMTAAEANQLDRFEGQVWAALLHGFCVVGDDDGSSTRAKSDGGGTLQSVGEVIVMSSWNETVCLPASLGENWAGLSAVSATDPLLITATRFDSSNSTSTGEDGIADRTRYRYRLRRQRKRRVLRQTASDEANVERYVSSLVWDTYTVVYRVIGIGDYFREQAMKELVHMGVSDYDPVLWNREAIELMQATLQTQLNRNILRGNFGRDLQYMIRATSSSSTNHSIVAEHASTIFASVVGREQVTFEALVSAALSDAAGNGTDNYNLNKKDPAKRDRSPSDGLSLSGPHDGSAAAVSQGTIESNFYDPTGVYMRAAGAILLILTLAGYFALLSLASKRRKRKRMELAEAASTQNNDPHHPPIGRCTSPPVALADDDDEHAVRSVRSLGSKRSSNMPQAHHDENKVAVSPDTDQKQQARRCQEHERPRPSRQESTSSSGSDEIIFDVSEFQGDMISKNRSPSEFSV